MKKTYFSSSLLQPGYFKSRQNSINEMKQVLTPSNLSKFNQPSSRETISSISVLSRRADGYKRSSPQPAKKPHYRMKRASKENRLSKENHCLEPGMKLKAIKRKITGSSLNASR